MRRWLAAVTVLAAVREVRADPPSPPPAPAGPAAPSPAPAGPDAPDAVLAAFRAGDRAALARLAALDTPDPWLVAHTLLLRGAPDAAEAFAVAAPRKDLERLPAFLASRRGRPPAVAAENALLAAADLLRAGDATAALARIDVIAPDDDEVLEVRRLSARAEGLGRLRRFADARAAVEAAASRAEALGWPSRARTALRDAARFARNMGDRAGTADLLRRWLRVAESRDDPRDLGWALGQLGNAELDLGRVDEALALQRRARSHWERLGDEEGLGAVLVDLASVLAARGENSGAVALLREALPHNERAGKKPVLAVNLSNLGQLLQRLGNLDEAATALERAVPLATLPGTRAKTLQAVGDLRRAQGELGRAITVLEEALEITEGLGVVPDRAVALTNLARVHGDAGDVARAIELGERAVGLLREHGVADRLFVALTNLGSEYRRSGDVKRALERLDEAARVGRTAFGGRRLGDALIERGRTENDRGESARALEILEAARAAYEVAGRTDGVASAWSTIGQVHHAAGRYAEALRSHERALLAARASRSDEHVGVALGNLATLLETLGDDDGAAARLAEARTLFASVHDTRNEASALIGLGRIDRKAGRHAEARDRIVAALAVARRVGDPRFEASARESLAAALQAAGDAAAARAELERALALQQRSSDPSATAVALLGLARVSRSLGATRDADDFARRAQVAAEAGPAGYYRATVFGGLASDALEAGRPQDAVELARTAVELESSLVRGLGDDLAAASRGAVADAAEAGLAAAVALDDAAAAVAFVERSRAGALLEALGGRAAVEAVVLPTALRDEELRARAEEVAAVARWRRAAASPEFPAARAAAVALEQARARVLEVADRASREKHAGARLLDARVEGLAEIATGLAPDEALVVYALPAREAVAIVVRRDASRIVALGPTPRLVEAAERALLALRDPGGAWQAPTDALRALVASPAILGLGPDVRRVLVVPDGALAHVPVGVLFGDREATVVPSGTVLGLLRREAAPRGAGVLALGDPVYETAGTARSAADLVRGGATRLSRLLATAEEARAVGDTVLLRAEATESALAAALATRPRWRAVHLACHGLVDTEVPALSCLALSPTATDDGFLTAIDVVRLRVAADLVVLSACETGRGRLRRGEGMVGLARAFLCAGAPRVLCSSWKVDDDATRALMQAFYARWNPREAPAALGVPAALRAAQQEVRSVARWAHPYYWAAWSAWGPP